MGTRFFLGHMQVKDTNIKGAIRINRSLAPRGLEIENVDILGDINVSRSYFSELALLKTRITGMVDIGETQTRCAYDIRNNELGDFVAVDVGFGLSVAETEFKFKANEKSSDPYSTFYNGGIGNSFGKALVDFNLGCASERFVNPGTFIFVNNRVKASLCIRSPQWLEGIPGVQSESNFYLTENNISGAAWLNFTPKAHDSRIRNARVCESLAVHAQSPDTAVDSARNKLSEVNADCETLGVDEKNSCKPWPPRAAKAQSSARPPDNDLRVLSIFNVRTGTLVLDFPKNQSAAGAPKGVRGICVKVNGLHFDRVYSSEAPCESALALREGKAAMRFEPASIPARSKSAETRTRFSAGLI